MSQGLRQRAPPARSRCDGRPSACARRSLRRPRPMAQTSTRNLAATPLAMPTAMPRRRASTRLRRRRRRPPQMAMCGMRAASRCPASPSAIRRRATTALAGFPRGVAASARQAAAEGMRRRHRRCVAGRCARSRCGRRHARPLAAQRAHCRWALRHQRLGSHCRCLNRAGSQLGWSAEKTRSLPCSVHCSVR